MIELYGIKQCDTCRKAWKWLDEQGLEYRFHDVRRDGIDRSMVDVWADAVGTETLINRRGQTWRRLDPSERDGLDEQALRALLLRDPTLIKRPVVTTPNGT
ncbi:MAG: Spx/MgsR family RNA polymerase-binding regulatory protein, partial [Halofilum sp. (in: g-proteobacteria)]